MSKPQPPHGGAVFDLASIEAELRQQDAYHRSGHTARTLIRVPDLRVVLIAIQGGQEIAEHTSEATTSIHTLSGYLRLHLPDAGRHFELPDGELLVIERGLPHRVEALVDSVLLLTLAWHGDARGG